MKETIMLFHIEDSRRLSAIRRALLPLKLRVKVISPEEYCQPVGYLAGAPDIAPVQSTGDTGEFSGEMMVMAWLSSRRVDQVLAALRKAGVGRINYKAVITPENQYWDCRKLYEELKKEHEAFTAAQEAVSWPGNRRPPIQKAHTGRRRPHKSVPAFRENGFSGARNPLPAVSGWNCGC